MCVRLLREQRAGETPEVQAQRRLTVRPTESENPAMKIIAFCLTELRKAQAP
jgi:hypothetical protein